jgi:hypothetical protein
MTPGAQKRVVTVKGEIDRVAAAISMIAIRLGTTTNSTTASTFRLLVPSTDHTLRLLFCSQPNVPLSGLTAALRQRLQLRRAPSPFACSSPNSSVCEPASDRSLSIRLAPIRQLTRLFLFLILRLCLRLQRV